MTVSLNQPISIGSTNWGDLANANWLIIQNSLNALFAPWTAFTTTVTRPGATIVPRSLQGRYMQMGQTMFVGYNLNFTTFTGGSGLPSVSLPNSKTAILLQGDFLGVKTI